MSIQIKRIACVVVLASASVVVACESSPEKQVNTAGYKRVVAKNGQEVFCQKVRNKAAATGTGGSVENQAQLYTVNCYSRAQLWEMQNPWIGDPLAVSSPYPPPR